MRENDKQLNARSTNMSARLSAEMRARMEELRPFRDEHQRLTAALAALDASDVRRAAYSPSPLARRRTMQRPFKTISLFSGCGGFDLGAERTGRAKVVWANDFEPAAVATYNKNFATEAVLGDVRSIEVPNVPCDLLIAGPPCQDFSVLWLHEGARTARGNLYFEVLRFLAELAPPAFILENVRGLLSANAGEAWALIRSGLKAPARALGTPHRGAARYDLSVEVVNFADLGAPQMRERLIVIGTRSDLRIPPIAIPRPYAGIHRSARSALESPELPSLGEANHELHEDAPDVTARLKLIPPGGNYESIPAGHPLAVKGLISHVYRRLDPDKPAYTVVAGGGGGSMGYHYAEPRSLTNRERARLQTFPDEFVFEGSIREIRAQIGNAVPPVGAEILVNTVAEALAGAGVKPSPSRRVASRLVVRQPAIAA
jgi:DNA (cytosine-5)-methyltransferase 1